MAELNLGQVVGPKGLQGIQGIKGNQGIQGIQGVVGPAVTITTTLGQSTTQAVSQKLLTDELGNISSILTTINGV